MTIETDSWRIHSDPETGALSLEFEQVLFTAEEEAAILAQHPHDDPMAHVKQRTIRLLLAPDDVDELARVLDAWKALEP